MLFDLSSVINMWFFVKIKRECLILCEEQLMEFVKEKENVKKGIGTESYHICHKLVGGF